MVDPAVPDTDPPTPVREAPPLPTTADVDAWLDSTGGLVPPYVSGPPPAPTREGVGLDAGAEIGPYRLVRAIGEGGMGTVYLAQQTDPVRRLVAVKLIRPGTDGRQVVARFEAERQALALMDHPHIARVFDGGTAPGGRPFFVMEFVDGVPITRFCDARRLPLPARLGLFADVCRAVHHAHQKGVIHRDLKPANVLVAEVDGVPVPKVIDFGIAKATAGALGDAAVRTAAGAVLGTPAYMAPEQAGGDPADVDVRADVYALGAILYELLTGSTPIPAETLRSAPLLDLLRMVREVDPPPPGRLAPGLPRELDWVTMRALAKERDGRYGSAATLAAEVRRVLADEPVEAGPPSALYRVRKFVRRNRTVVAAAAVAALALVGGLTGTTWGMLRATEEAGRKEEARREAADQSARATAAELARRVELGRTAGVAAELAARQGQWEEAIRLYDRALALAPEDEVGLQLGRLGCSLALSRFQDARAALDDLTARPDLGRHRGRVLLERAEMALYLPDAGDPRDLARQALAAGLPPVDDGYARVFLADTVPDALGPLRDAVRRDPFHRSAPQMLATLLFVSGRVDEFREVAAGIRATRPDSVAVLQMDVLLRAVDGDRAGLDRAVARLSESAGGVGAAATRAVAELLLIFARDEWVLVRGLPPDRALALAGGWATLGPEMERVGGGADGAGAGLTLFRLPMFRPLGDLPAVKAAAANPVAALALADPAALADLFGAVADVCPEGTVLLIRGGALERAGRLTEAEAAFCAAADAPGWSNHRRAALCRVMLARDQLAKDPARSARSRLVWRVASLAAARRLAGSGPLPGDIGAATAGVAFRAGDVPLSLALAETALRADPGLPVLLVRKVKCELALRELALGALDRATTAAAAAVVATFPDMEAVVVLADVARAVEAARRLPVRP